MLDSQRPKCSVVNGNIWKFALSLMCYILAPHMYCHWISLYILFLFRDIPDHEWRWFANCAKVKKTNVGKHKLPDFGAVLVDNSMIEYKPFPKQKPDCGPLNMKLETWLYQSHLNFVPGVNGLKNCELKFHLLHLVWWFWCTDPWCFSLNFALRRLRGTRKPPKKGG